MIDDESLLGKLLDQRKGCGQLLRVNENVISEAEFLQRRDAPPEVVAEQKVVVRFRLHDVTKAAELVKVRKVLQPEAHIGRTKINPADDARNRVVLRRKFQEEKRLALDWSALARLHSHPSRSPPTHSGIRPANNLVSARTSHR